jgi:hypothetical protein
MSARNKPGGTEMLKLRNNKTSVHIEGLASVGTYGENAGTDTGKGYVSYSPYSHCSGLTRGAVRMGYVTLGVRNKETDEVEKVTEWATPAEALEAARLYARIYGGKVCTTCEKAAQAQ